MTPMLGAPVRSGPASARSDGVQVACCPESRVKFQAKSPIPDPSPTRDAAGTIGSGPELQAAGSIGEVG